MTLAERNQLVVDHLPLARNCARKLHRRCSKVELEDLEQAGAVGLIQAANRYDPSQGPFSPFAMSRAYGAILDVLRAPNGHRREVEALHTPSAILADARGDEGTAYVEARETVGWVLKSLGAASSLTLQQHYLQDVPMTRTGDVTFARRARAVREARKLLECAA